MRALLDRLLATFAAWWERLRDAALVLRPCRVSAAVVLAGAALLASPQGQELTVRLPSEALAKSFWFQVCVFLWAFQSWYWSRIILDAIFGADRNADLVHPRAPRIRALIAWIPRLIAVTSYAVAFVACLLAGWSAWATSLMLFVEGGLFLVFLVWRKEIVRQVEKVGAPKAQEWGRKLMVDRGTHPAALRSLPLLARVINWLTLAFIAGLTAWVCLDPVDFGWFFGAAAVPYLGFALIVPVGSLLVLWTREGGAARLADGAPRSIETMRGYPVISTLIIVAVALSFFPFLDNHGVRTLAAPKPQGSDLEAFLDRWHAQAPRRPDGRTNFVVVSAAGGGLRAAYLTATVLGAVQDAAPELRRQLVGVSGVSGGSLGATVFVTLLAQPGPSATRCEQPGIAIGPLECLGQTVLSNDFLGPTVAALLFPDLMHRFLPLGFPDRAKALEQSWERAWTRAGYPDEVWKDRGFRALWSGEAYLPALLLNGTHVESGKRVITSNLDIAARPDVFRDAHDFYTLAPSGREIRPSTAAHNSARFTYVSPAGTLDDGTHIVDGGYFENFGAATAHELLQAGLRRFGRKIRPVVVLISNDPTLEAGDLPTSPPSGPLASRPRHWLGEVLSPLRALLNTRDARGLLAASELRELGEARDRRYFQFRLCENGSGRSPALGWVLSKESEQLMREQLRNACGNDKEFAALLEVLAGH